MVIDMSSSPDPLNNSYPSPTKVRCPLRSRSSITSHRSSPKKQTFQLDVGDEFSPHKIRVTVEAGDSNAENVHSLHDIVPSSPTRLRANQKERTTTTTIPVKGLSDLDDEIQQITIPNRGGERPSKPTSTPIVTKKRACSPTRKSKRRSRAEFVCEEGSLDTEFSAGRSVQPSRERRKSSSRSRFTKGASQRNTLVAKNSHSDKNVPSTTCNNSGSPRKGLLPNEAFLLEDNFTGTDFGGQGSYDDDIGALNEVNSNRSTLSSVNPTALTQNDNSEGVLALPNPVNEPPHIVGRSSSPSTKASHSSTSVLSPKQKSYSSSVSHKKLFSVKNDELSHTEELGHAYAHDCEAAELLEHDTILESEEFSMISIESVPSLREHLGSPANQKNGMNQHPRNKRLLSGQECHQNSFSTASTDTLQAGKRGRKFQNHTLLSPRSIRVKNSLSSIPSVLESVTPENLSSNLSGSKDRTHQHDGSYSTIPAVTLDAATPVEVRHGQPLSEKVRDLGQQLHPSSAHALGSLASRLLTPDDTPSPLYTSDEQIIKTNSQPSRTVLRYEVDVSADHLNLPSSPPSATARSPENTTHIKHQNSFKPNLAQTPSVVFSSPSLPPPIKTIKCQVSDASAPQKLRPTLSPTVAAGRVLQDILVPSSPKELSQSLGSPFTSPLSEEQHDQFPRLGSLLSPSYGNLTSPLPRMDLDNQLPHCSSHLPQERQHRDKPHRKDPKIQAGSPSSEMKLGLPHHQCNSNPRVDGPRIADRFPASDNGRNWKSEDIRTKFDQHWINEGATLNNQIAGVKTQKFSEIYSDDDQEEDKDVNLLIQTINSSSPAVSQATVQEKSIYERPRRSTLPSLWRQESKRLVSSDELSNNSALDPPEALHVGEKIDDEAISESVTAKRAFDQDASEQVVSSSLSDRQIPHKTNPKARIQETPDLDLSALLTASPMRRLPTMPISCCSSMTQSSLTKELSNESSQWANAEPARSLESDSISDDAVSQQAGFNLKHGAFLPIKTRSFPPRILGESPATHSLSKSDVSSANSGPLTDSSNSQTTIPQLQQALSNQVSPLMSVEDLHSSPASSGEKENVISTERVLQWNESVKLSLENTSTMQPSSLPSLNFPTKSCRQSPIKTPCVDAAGPLSETSPPTKGVTFASSSPMPSCSTTSSPLSSTIWTRSHWLVLDNIMQSWKPENNCTPCSSASQYSNSSKDGRSTWRRNSTRVVSQLLGKHVFGANGERMMLEQWHLEAVDEFRHVVPGWEEKAIAMRIWALLTGERVRAEKKEKKEAEQTGFVSLRA